MFDAKITWSPQFIAKADAAFAQGGKLQKHVDGTVLESIEPYVPHDTGMLIASGIKNTLPVLGSGVIIWKTPYAQAMYRGINWRTGRPFIYHGGGKRGSFWPERWMRDNMVAFEADINAKARELL